MNSLLPGAPLRPARWSLLTGLAGQPAASRAALWIGIVGLLAAAATPLETARAAGPGETAPVAGVWPRSDLAFITRPDGAAGRGDLPRLLVELGVEARDLGAEIEAGGRKPALPRILLVGPQAAASVSIRDWLDAEAGALREMIERGGCLVVFAQPRSARPLEDWMPPGLLLVRGGARIVHPGFVHRQHPLFSRPNAISHRRFAADWSGTPVSESAFLAVSRGAVLAAADAVGHDPFCVEFGWGRGRVLYLACTLAAARTTPPATRLLIRELVENLLAYARDVTSGRPADLPDGAQVTHSASCWRPRVWDDEPRARFSFENGVNQAVDRGVAWLEKRQRADGSWARRGPHTTGPTALAVVALLGAGVSKHEPFISRAIDYLLAHPPDPYATDSYTYDIGLTMMALDAWAAPIYERIERGRQAATERVADASPRDLPEEARDLMVRCRDFLVATQKQGGYWSYTAGDPTHPGDLSNTQFAILGLWAASRCGVSIPTHVWTGVIEALLESQAESGPDVVVPSFVRPVGEGDRPRFYMVRSQARAWGYTPRGRGGAGVTGSRTAMGISSLLIVRDDLSLHHREVARRHERAVGDAVGDGLAWLWSHFSVAENPLAGGSHPHYYLYALERVGVLAQIRFLGDRDWYREGAARLLATQDRAGSWGMGLTSTSFALMFLRRSTPPPVTTGPRR